MGGLNMDFFFCSWIPSSLPNPLSVWGTYSQPPKYIYNEGTYNLVASCIDFYAFVQYSSQNQANIKIQVSTDCRLNSSLSFLNVPCFAGKIPPESILIFSIDLLDIRNGPRSHESFQEMDLNDDWKLSKQEVRR